MLLTSLCIDNIILYFPEVQYAPHYYGGLTLIRTAE